VTWQPKDPAHAQLWQSLLTHVADRPAHLRYLRSMEAIIVSGADAETVTEKITDLEPGDVSARVMDALQEDVLWLVEADLGAPLPEGHRRSAYPNAYRARRITDGRAARQRNLSRQGLEPLLQLKSKEN
jgi:hypothetical protein